jgi:hypothetical protein
MEFEMTEICKIDGTEHKSFISLTRYIKKLGIVYKDYHDSYLKVDGEGVCPNCGNTTPFIKGRYRKFCNFSCSSYYIGKHHTPTHTEESKRKLSDSWKDRDPSWLLKRRKTIEEKYDMSYTDFKRKLWYDRFDNMSPEEIQNFHDKSVLNQGRAKSRKFKEYVLGENVVLIQGYENYVLDVICEFYSPNEIFVGRCKHKMVRYFDVDGTRRRYFPDIYLPDNVIIEVKCPYTLKNNLETTLLKMKYAYEQGYKPILVVWEKKIDIVEMCKKSLIETISSQAWNCPGRFRDYPYIGVGHKQTMLEVLGIQI